MRKKTALPPKLIIFGYIVCAIIAIAFIITGGVKSGTVTQTGTDECCDQGIAYITNSTVNIIVCHILLIANATLFVVPINKYKHKLLIAILLCLPILLIPIQFTTFTGGIGGWTIQRTISPLLVIEKMNEEIRIYPHIILLFN